MVDARVVKWLGLLCLLAGIARMGMTPSALMWGTDSPQELTFGYTACILMAVSSIVLYLAQSRETGVLGFISTVAITVGNVLTAALVFVSFLFNTENPPPEHIVVAVTGMGSMATMGLGTLLLTILMFRARVFPLWVPILFGIMILSIAIPIADNMYFALFWGLAYVGAGWCIWTGRLQPRAVHQTLSA